MARLSANGWRDTRRVRGTSQWQSHGPGLAQTGSNYDGGHGRYDSGNRYDSSSTRESQASPRYSEGSSRHDSARHEDRTKYDSNEKSDGPKYSAAAAAAKCDANKKFEAAREPEQNGSEEQVISASLIGAFEKKITSVQQEMSSSLQEATSKENEKFDLIFSILIELQRRQAQLEESVRSLKTQLQRMNGPMTMQMGASAQPQQQQQQGQMQTSSNGSTSNSTHNGTQVSSPMGQQQMCFTGGQMQCGNMVGHDGSMQMVFVMNSPNGSQMPYAIPQMMCPSGAMPAMQQQMPVQFVPQGQGNNSDEYQWGANGDGGTGSQTEGASVVGDNSGNQPLDCAPQEVAVPDNQKAQVETHIEEE